MSTITRHWGFEGPLNALFAKPQGQIDHPWRGKLGQGRIRANVPRVKHIVAPRIQHHVTEEGPPRVKGVLKVVATLEQRPIILNAKLICR